MLVKLGRSAALALVALAGTANLCCSLPQVKPRMAADFASGQTRVERVAILPVDLGVQVEGENHVLHPDGQLGAGLVERINTGLSTALQRRGYEVAAVIDPDGRARSAASTSRTLSRLVIHPTDLSALRIEIHQATSCYAPGPGLIEARVSADLPRQIRAATGADASLYARGWVVVRRGESKAATAARVIGITLLVVVIVGLIVLWVAGGRNGGGGAIGGAGRALAAAGEAAVKAAAAVGHVVIRTAPYVLEGMARAAAAGPPVHCVRCPSIFSDEPFHASPAPPAASVAHDQTLAMHQGEPPERSTVGLAVSLLHNPSGRVLWHAGQAFEVDAREADLERTDALIEHFFQELPARRR